MSFSFSPDEDDVETDRHNNRELKELRAERNVKKKERKKEIRAGLFAGRVSSGFHPEDDCALNTFNIRFY